MGTGGTSGGAGTGGPMGSNPGMAGGPMGGFGPGPSSGLSGSGPAASNPGVAGGPMGSGATGGVAAGHGISGSGSGPAASNPGVAGGPMGGNPAGGIGSTSGGGYGGGSASQSNKGDYGGPSIGTVGGPPSANPGGGFGPGGFASVGLALAAQLGDRLGFGQALAAPGSTHSKNNPRNRGMGSAFGLGEVPGLNMNKSQSRARVGQVGGVSTGRPNPGQATPNRGVAGISTGRPSPGMPGVGPVAGTPSHSPGIPSPTGTGPFGLPKGETDRGFDAVFGGLKRAGDFFAGEKARRDHLAGLGPSRGGGNRDTELSPNLLARLLNGPSGR